MTHFGLLTSCLISYTMDCVLKFRVDSSTQIGRPCSCLTENIMWSLQTLLKSQDSTGNIWGVGVGGVATSSTKITVFASYHIYTCIKEDTFEGAKQLIGKGIFFFVSDTGVYILESLFFAFQCTKLTGN